MLIWEQEDANTTPPDETLPPGGLTQKLLYWNPVTSKWEPIGIGAGLQVVNGELVITGGGSGGNTDTFWSSVNALLQFNGTNGSQTFTDSKGNTVGVGGNVQITNNPILYGSGSALFDGNGDWLSLPRSVFDLSIITDFTLDISVYPTTGGSTNQVIFSTYNLPGGAQSNTFILTNTVISNGVQNLISFTLTLNTWNRIRITRTTGTIRLWINGSFIGSSTGSIAQSSNPVYIGGSPGDNNLGSWWFNGAIDEFRITAASRNTTDANYNVETSEFPTS